MKKTEKTVTAEKQAPKQSLKIEQLEERIAPVLTPLNPGRTAGWGC